MQWNKTPCAYLQQNCRSVQNQEQTQEVRLPEGMPDIGSVLCAWGQVILRSKEWRADAILVSGGVQASVLYKPEDGSSPQNVECWLPFQAKWNFSDSKREGIIRTSCALRSIDARSLSARKLMVRASVGLLGEALEMTEATLYSPEDVPQDVQLLQRNYPVNLPKEAGEKLFMLEEEITPDPMPAKLLAWDVEPVMTEQTVLGGRVVFKGNARLHLVFLDSSSQLYSGCYDLPFAQYAQLDQDYDKEATVSTMLAVSSLEPEMLEDRMKIKCGIIAQYLIHDRQYLQLTQDAYSPYRNIQQTRESLTLPVMLDQCSRSLEARQNMDISLSQVVEAAFYPDLPLQYREGEEIVIEMPGVFQVLGYDGEGKLCAATENWTDRISIPAAQGCTLGVDVKQPGPVTMSLAAGQPLLQSLLQMDIQTQIQQPMAMVTDLELGQELQPDPQRPSLILRRIQEESLWTLAKNCGSTMDAIRKANQLTADPAPGQMLLIPVC